MSIRVFGPALRQAGAEARGVLMQMAAERLQVPVERLTVKAGVVSDTAGAKKSVTYAQLTEGKRIERHLDVKPPVKSVNAFSVIGRPIARRDAVDKVTGKAKYAGDLVPAGALHARILRPPAHGAVMTQVETSAAEKVPGVHIVRDGDMVAVLHERRDEAAKALALIKAQFTRNDPPVDDKTIFDYLVKKAPAPRTAAEGGSLQEGERLVSEVIEHRYEDSYVAHAAMETHSAVAVVENGKVTVWAGTQTPFPLKSQVMEALRLPADKVRVGYILSEEVHFKGGEILDTNFDTYELPRFSWVPRIEATIVDAPDIASQGGGEPAIVPVGAVVANAIFDATGARLFRMAMTPERLKAALART